MKLNNILDVNGFMNEICNCDGDVFVLSTEGDKFNMKSSLSRYIAIERIIVEHGKDLELLCENKYDAEKLSKFLIDN